MISKLTISGFRGVPRELHLDFARITLLAGRNGFGKTTVFDAIDWCLFGGAWRLGEESEATRNLYRSSLRPRVSIVMDTLEGETVVERTEDGALLNKERISDRELALTFMRDPEMFGPYARDVEARVRRFVYLPQAEIRELLQPAAETERVAIMQGLLGVPNAAVVEKSIRRVQNRMAEREANIVRRLEEVRTDIADASSHLSPIYDHGGLDRDAEILRARNVLGEQGKGVESVDGLLALAVAEGEKARRRKSELQELRTWLGTAADRRAWLLSEVSRRQGEVIALETAVAEGDDSLRAAVARREDVQLDLSRLRDRASLTARRLEELRRLSARLEALRNAETQKASIEENIAHAERDTGPLRKEIAALETQLQPLRDLIDRQRGELAEWRSRDARFQESNEVERRLEAINRDLARERGEKAAAEAALNSAEGELLEAKQAKHVADLRYQEALSREPTNERLRSLLDEVARAIEEGDSSRCPLCGAEHESKPMLLQHVRETAGARKRGAAELSSRAAELRTLEALVGRKEVQASQHRERAAGVRQREALLVRDLRMYNARLVAIAPEEHRRSHPAEGQRIQTMIEAREAEVEALRKRLADLRLRLQGHEAEVTRLKEELLLASGRMADVVSELGGRDVPDARSRLPEDLQSAETEHRRIVAQVGIGQEQIRAAEEDARRLDEATETARRRVVDVRERIAADNSRLQSLEDETKNRVRDVLGTVQGNTQDTIGQLLAEIQKQEAEVERVRLAMESLSSIQIQDEIRSRLSSLQSRRSDIEAEQRQIAIARERFDSICGTVRARADREAREALVYQTTAIQDCLDALLPHRHLNRVVWDSSSGSIFLTDRLLIEAVRPDIYGSTGQINVLALSVFLGVALLQRVTTLGFIALDEPVQNLDDVHFLAFITLIKRIAGSRQVIFSTADSNVAELFRRQMKSSWDAARYVQWEWRAFDPITGPDVVSVADQVRGRAFGA